MSKITTKIKLILSQNLAAFLVVFFWFLGNYLLFLFLTSCDFIESTFILFYFKSHESLYGNFYGSFTEFIIFGLVFSLITIELFRKYNPVDTCREIAKTMNNHVVIIGYNHIGQRVAKYLKERGDKVVIIEKKRDLVKELIEKEEPLVNDDALFLETLTDASVKEAKGVLIVADDLEVQFVVTANVRRLNKDCKIICRIFEDEIADVIAKTYNALIISTSKFTSNVILNEIRIKHYQNIELMGMNHITERIIKKSQKRGFSCHLIEENEEKIEDAMLKDERVICGDPRDIEILKKAKIEQADCIFIAESDIATTVLLTKRVRDLNPKCKIISRFFNENVAEVLEKPPFRSEVISSSMHTLKIMIDKGMLNFPKRNLFQ